MKAELSKDQLSELINFIDRLLSVARKTLHLGLVVLEKERAETEDPWMKRGLDLLLRGAESDVIQRVFLNSLFFHELPWNEQLRIRLIMEAMICFCRRDSMEDIEDILFSVVGDEGRNDYLERIRMDRQQKVEDYLSVGPGTVQENSATGNMLQSFNDRQITIFLEQVNGELLAPFLSGESHALQCRILTLLDEESQQEVVDQLETGFLDISMEKARKLVGYRIRRISGEFRNEEILSQKEVDELLQLNRKRK